jgi:hypothetical protein
VRRYTRKDGIDKEKGHIYRKSMLDECQSCMGGCWIRERCLGLTYGGTRCCPGDDIERGLMRVTDVWKSIWLDRGFEKKRARSEESEEMEEFTVPLSIALSRRQVRCSECMKQIRCRILSTHVFK